ncbi:MAG: hypothetical protein ABFS17_09630 [Chloroflexota bacterium]
MYAFEVFSYPLPERPNPGNRINRLAEISAIKDPLPLSGLVHGRRASDLEERFARGLDSAGLAYRFQYRVKLEISLPGREKVIDFLVELGWRYPVEIDGVIAHRTAAQQGADRVREILLNDSLRRRGIFPIQRLRWWQLASQEMADRVVREMFGGK